ncbi:MAG: FAD-dependent oxidoreductase [Verrucomicrobiales bacterium]
MRVQRLLAVCLLLVAFLKAQSLAAPMEPLQADLCVFGGTSGGVAAAVHAARNGLKVILLEPGTHLGGMTSGGLGQTDIGNKGAIGGISREFYQRVGKHYQKEESWVFEPHMAERVFFQMINEAKVAIYFQQGVESIQKEDGRIVKLFTTGGKTIQAKIYIDTSYEGDLMARAGVSYTVGREANKTYNETLNGVRETTPKHQFVVPVDPYITPGDSASGVIPLIQTTPNLAAGEADKSVQAYNFRLVLTKRKENQRPIEPPPGYNPATYELLGRYLTVWAATENKPTLGQLMHIQMMPGGKTDINNNGGFSTDFIGANYDYPEADYARRDQIKKEHENYTRGFLHFLATDARVPVNIRNDMQSWGLTRDEFVDTHGWPHQLYVREARRMISDYVMTEHNCVQSIKLDDAIGLAAYTMDSHNCQRVIKNGKVENEGDVQVGGFPPYQIAYRSIVPKREECKNLLVPVALSASHIAYGSIRMEPVFMVLGHSAATAAKIAIENNSAVQEVNHQSLQKQLIKEKQVLEWTAPKH